MNIVVCLPGWLLNCLHKWKSSIEFLLWGNSFRLLGWSVYLFGHISNSVLWNYRNISQSNFGFWILYSSIWCTNSILSFSNYILWKLSWNRKIFVLPSFRRWCISNNRCSRSVITIGFLNMIDWLNSLQNSGSGSGPSSTYAVNQANAVPLGTASTMTATLTLTFNTNTNTYTSSGWINFLMGTWHFFFLNCTLNWLIDFLPSTTFSSFAFFLCDILFKIKAGRKSRWISFLSKTENSSWALQLVICDSHRISISP